MPAPRWSAGGQRKGLPPPGSQMKDDDESEIPLSQAAPNAQPTQLERPRDCINRHSTPAFTVLCALMDRLRSDEASKRRDNLIKFFDIWRKKVGNDLYPLIRLLLPDRDRERPVYHLKEAMLAKCYIEVLGLDRNSDAAQRLIKWKQPVEGQDGVSGDFARVCYHEIAARSTVEEGTLSVEAVNKLLDELAKGRLKQNEIVPILRRINEQCTAAEQEWLIRIILKDLRISIREKTVFSCFHPDAAALFNVCSDLKRVCWTLYKPEIRLEKSQANIELFRCFLPQLCHRSPNSSHDVIAKLVGGPTTEFVMEEKLDGERLQVHMRGNGSQWFYCSRKAKDYTYLYGSHIGEGSLTPYLAGIFQDDVRNVILDGEMMVWDPVLEKYLAFGSLKTAALDKTADDSSPRPCFKVFDILYLNDRCLTGKRLSERKRLLRSGRVFRSMDDYKGRLEFVEERKGKTGKDIRAMLDEVLESKGEGLVVKRADSQYVTNSRAAEWVKVKPEYADQMGENLDLLVLGGWWGKGGRTGKISSLLLGLRVQQEDDGSGELPVFKTFASVGSGMSYEDYEWILNKHKGHWKPFDRKNPPKWMEVGAIGIDDKPDVYIPPDKSFVMEVKASEIVQAAGNYGAGYTLRFPRCRFIFWDRASREHPSSDEHRDRDMWNCLSMDEFEALLNKPKKRYADDENGTSIRKKRKVTTRRKVELFRDIKGQKLGDDSVESAVFSDLTFYIPKDAPGHKKAELEALVHRHGGAFTQAQLGDNSAIVISHDDKTPRVKAQIRKGNSIVKPEWILESIARRRPLPLIKEFLVFASDQTKEDRYYNKTLAEVDKISLVRDRTGSQLDRSDEEEEEEEAEDEEREPSPPRTQAEVKADKAAEKWGLMPRSHGTGRREADSEEEETEDERDRSEEEDEDYDEDGGPISMPPKFVSPTQSAGSDLPESRVDGKYTEENDEENGHENGDDESDKDKPLLRVHDREKPTGAMGDDADTYDDEQIFNHLVFYIDTPENAAKNDLAASDPPKEAGERLASAASLLRSNGGRLTTVIDDQRLTHVIMDDADSGRYVAIMRRTSGGGTHKHIVLPSWVDECVDEETLMNEDAHKPA